MDTSVDRLVGTFWNIMLTFQRRLLCIFHMEIQLNFELQALQFMSHFCESKLFTMHNLDKDKTCSSWGSDQVKTHFLRNIHMWPWRSVTEDNETSWSLACTEWKSIFSMQAANQEDIWQMYWENCNHSMSSSSNLYQIVYVLMLK